MDVLATLLDEIKQQGLAQGNLLGFFHVMIGRRISKTDGTVLSAGLAWRELANYLKKARWEPEGVRELGLEPDDLPPRDRQRYWYGAIARAGVDSPKARQAGDAFAKKLDALGYTVGPAPQINS